MVQTKSRPRRRTKGAGPERKEAAHGAQADAEFPVDKYPNLRAHQEMDHVRHVQAAREMGATRKQASEHASAEVGGH